jgi:DNA-binding SARP family transcriptional activator
VLAAREQAAGRLDAALEHWRQTVALQPTEAEYQRRLVRCLLAAGRQAEAETALQKMVVRFGDDPLLREEVEKSPLSKQPVAQPAPGAGDGD